MGKTTLFPIPVEQWVHLEIYYKASSQSTPNGEFKFWQDGQLILQAVNVVTLLDEAAIWGLGNYTDHIDGSDGCGSATLYFDDCIVDTEPIHPHINNCPTPPNQNSILRT